MSYSGYEYRFRRNAQGALDPNGEYAPEGTYLKMNYTKQLRLSIGVRIVKYPGDETLVGFRAPPFDYTSKCCPVENTLRHLFGKEK